MVLPLVLAGCGGAPWVDDRREAGTDLRVGQSTLDQPVVCYAAETPMSEVQALAEAVCAKTSRHAALVATTPWSCRLATPDRATFRCE